MKINKLNAKFRVYGTERYISQTVPKSNGSCPESFAWKDVNWKKIQLRLNNLQYKIFAAKKENNMIEPIVKGGKHVISNLQLVHASPCHDYKKY